MLNTNIRMIQSINVLFLMKKIDILEKVIELNF